MPEGAVESDVHTKAKPSTGCARAPRSFRFSHRDAQSRQLLTAQFPSFSASSVAMAATGPVADRQLSDEIER